MATIKGMILETVKRVDVADQRPELSRIWKSQ